MKRPPAHFTLTMKRMSSQPLRNMLCGRRGNESPGRKANVLADVDVHWDVRIPLRDGIHLSALHYRPREPGRQCPAIVTLTPYVAQTFHDIGLYFAAHGYPFLSVDVRGRGNSEGVFTPCFNAAADGHDVVE